MKKSVIYNNGFTLAEMMVVLLIASIILACMAPVMTTKMKADQSIQTSPWKWVQQGAGRNTDAYFGNGDLQMAYIGQTARSDADNAKLVINNSNFDNMLLFKNGGNVLGHLRIDDNILNIGTENVGAVTLGHKVDGGFGSVAIGSNIMTNTNHNSAPSGHHNIALGLDALSANTTGHWSEAIGRSALASNTTGAENIAVGIYSLSSNTTGSRNTVLGSKAGSGNIEGNNNVVIGYNANNAVANMNNVVVIGSNASANFDSNIAIGFNASALKGNAIAIGNNSNAGTSSIMIGSNAGKAITSGYENTVIGSYAFINNTTGSSNIAVGPWAMQENTTGFGNVAFGTHALNSNKTSNYNTALGHYAGSSASGANNIMIGAFSAQNLTGSNNIAIGSYACRNVRGSNKVCIGANSGPSSTNSTDDEVIYIGSKPKFPSSGWYFSDWGSNSAVLEIHNTEATSKFNTEKNTRRGYENGPSVYINGNLIVRGYIGGLIADDRGDENDEWGWLSSNKPTGDGNAVKWGYVSDRRLKYVGKENNDGLAKLRQLKVFNYTFKKDKTKTPRVGVIAQDLQKIFPNAVKKGADGFLSIRMEDMFYAVINAIKELDAKYKAQEKRIDELEKRIKELETKIK